jgi:hypothetical protein
VSEPKPLVTADATVGPGLNLQPDASRIQGVGLEYAGSQNKNKNKNKI